MYIFCTTLIIFQLACSSIGVKGSTRNQNSKRSSSSRRDRGRSSGQNASASAVRWTGKLCAGHQVCPGVCPAAGWDGGIGMAHGGMRGTWGRFGGTLTHCLVLSWVCSVCEFECASKCARRVTHKSHVSRCCCCCRLRGPLALSRLVSIVTGITQRVDHKEWQQFALCADTTQPFLVARPSVWPVCPLPLQAHNVAAF